MVRPRDTVRHLKVLRSQKRAWFSWRVHYLKVRVICFKECNLFEKQRIKSQNYLPRTLFQKLVRCLLSNPRPPSEMIKLIMSLQGRKAEIILVIIVYKVLIYSNPLQNTEVQAGNYTLRVYCIYIVLYFRLAIISLYHILVIIFSLEGIKLLVPLAKIFIHQFSSPG